MMETTWKRSKTPVFVCAHNRHAYEREVCRILTKMPMYKYKIQKIASICFITLLALTSCAKSQDSSNTPDIKSAPEQNPNVGLCITDIGQNIDAYMKMKNSEYYVDTFCNEILITSDTSFEDMGHYRENISNPEIERSPFAAEEPAIVASGNCILMEERYFYTTGVFPVDRGYDSVRQLIKMDTITGEQTVIDSKILSVDDRPFIYLAKFDETRFLSCEINSDSSIIKLHNSLNDDMSQIIVFNHKRINGVMQGEILMDACVSNGRIFASICLGQQEPEYYLKEFDVTGRLINTYRSPEFSAFLENSALCGIYCLGDYLFLRDWDSNHIIFHLDGDELKQYPLFSNDLMFYTNGLDNIYTDTYNHYIYLTNTHDNLTQQIYVFDTQSGNLTSIELPLSNTEKVISSVISDEFGNIILRYQDYDNKSGMLINPSYFFVSHSDVVRHVDASALRDR